MKRISDEAMLDIVHDKGDWPLTCAKLAAQAQLKDDRESISVDDIAKASYDAHATWVELPEEEDVSLEEWVAQAIHAMLTKEAE